MTERLLPPHPLVVTGRRAAARALAATSTGSWRLATAAALVLGGAAAGWRSPAAPDYLQLATGAEIWRRAGAMFMAAPEGSLDLRSWLAALLILGLHHAAGAAGLVALTVGLGAVFGLLLGAAGWRAGAHPLALALGGGMALLALGQLPATASTYWLAALGAAALLLLAEVRRGRRLALVGMVLLGALWANLESAAVVLPPALLLLAVADRLGSAERRIPWLLAPATAVAVMLNPQGPWIYARLPLSLGQGGEHPALALWSSPNFHPWSMRMVELAALLLLASYLVAAPRLRPGDALVGLLGAGASLLWAFYLPLLVATEGVQVPGLLTPRPWRSGRVGAARGATLALVLPVLALLGLGISAARLGGRAAEGTIPAGAVAYLGSAGGVWYTTSALGDYLAADFPQGRHLMCVTDAPAAGPARLETCQSLSQLSSGTMARLRESGVRLAVLPPADPAVAFLHAQGWRTRYRDGVVAVLTPPPSGL